MTGVTPNNCFSSTGREGLGSRNDGISSFTTSGFFSATGCIFLSPGNTASGVFGSSISKMKDH